MDKLEDVHVLCLNAACGVNHEDADVAVLNGTDGAHDAVELQVFGHLVLTPYACRVDQVEVEAELVVAGVDGVARGTGNVGHDVTLLADKGIDEARLAGVGTSHDGETGNALLQIVARLLGQHLQYFVEQVARAAAGSCTDAERVAQPQFVELVLSVQVLAVISLVGHEQRRQFGTAQYLSHVQIPVGDSVLDVAEEEHQVGLLGGNDDLLADFLLEDIVRVDHPAAGIDDRELASVPLTLAVLPVACRAGFIAHNGLTRLGQTVKQGRLSHIRAPYDGY